MQGNEFHPGVVTSVHFDFHCPKAFFLVGPTASGKTEIAHFLARKFHAAILSADSMLVYRGLDVGTAKPTEAERRDVRYFGIDVVDPSENFSAGKFQECARAAWAYCSRYKRVLFVTGGTGLYIKCLTEGLAKAPAADPELREKAENIFRSEGIPGLLHALKRADPLRAQTIADPKNPRRLIRALELAWRGIPVKRTWRADLQSTLVGLQWPPYVLSERIAQRVRQMFAGGLIDEVARLLSEGKSLSLTARHAIGYREAIAVLEGRISLEEAIDLTIRRTRQLAKRQMTWFRHQARVVWVVREMEQPIEEVAQKVVSLWNIHGSAVVHI